MRCSRIPVHHESSAYFHPHWQYNGSPPGYHRAHLADVAHTHERASCKGWSVLWRSSLFSTTFLTSVFMKEHKSQTSVFMKEHVPCGSWYIDIVHVIKNGAHIDTGNCLVYVTRWRLVDAPTIVWAPLAPVETNIAALVTSREKFRMLTDFDILNSNPGVFELYTWLFKRI